MFFDFQLHRSISFYMRLLLVSMSAISDFVQKVNSDPELTKKIKEIGHDNSATVAFAKSIGFDFTENDIQSFYKDHLPDDHELSDAAMTSVSGGSPTLLAAAVVGAAASSAGAAAGVTSTTQGHGW